MNILIIGSGICGLGTALLLARDGHEVTVLERDCDPQPVSPPTAWDDWQRPGVAQFRQPHNLMPGLRLLLESELPDVQDALRNAGAARYDLSRPLPPFFADQSPRPIDEQLWTYTARRPVTEWVFAQAAALEPGVTMRRGFRVAGLAAGRSAGGGTPHVTGVRGTGGEAIAADLVVDATGRQSRGVEWLEAIGARPPLEERADSGFAYYTRYFRGTLPESRTGALMHIGTMSLLTLPGDNGTWSVTVFVAGGDQPLKSLRHEDTWMKVVRACPLHAHWLDGEPISDVLAMGGIVDRYRRFVVDGSPVATGFVAVADAWACTNPSAGRGLTVGFRHAVMLRDVVRDAAGDPAGLVQEFDARTEAEVTPWYQAQRIVDIARFGEMEALRQGAEPPMPEDGLSRAILGLLRAMPTDPELFRAALEYIGTITPVQEILRRPEVAERLRAAQEHMKDAPPMRPPGPDRPQLLELLK